MAVMHRTKHRTCSSSTNGSKLAPVSYYRSRFNGRIALLYPVFGGCCETLYASSRLVSQVTVQRRAWKWRHPFSCSPPTYCLRSWRWAVQNSNILITFDFDRFGFVYCQIKATEDRGIGFLGY